MAASPQDFRIVHGLFLKIVQEMAGGSLPVPAAVQAYCDGAESDSGAMQRWLWLLDAGVGPDRFRRAVEQTRPSNAEIQALVRYLAGKEPPGEADIERLEWLVTHLFRNPASGAEASSSSEMLREIQTWLGQERKPLSGMAEALLAELVEVLEDVVACASFGELSNSGLISRGRRIKQRFRGEFVSAPVLAAVVNYNLVSGRKFQQLLSTAGSEVPADLASREYRAATEEFRQIKAPSAAPGRSPAAGRAPAASAPPPASAAPGAAEARPISVAELARKIAALGIDPNMEEGRLRSITSELTSFARAAGRNISEFPLPHSTLRLNPWEVQSLQVDYPGTEKSFRAGFNRAVRRAVSLLAMIQEESVLYDMQRHSEFNWKKHADALIYSLYCGEANVADLEALLKDAGGRGLEEKATQLTQTLAQLRLWLQQVAEFCRQWTDSPGQTFSTYR